MPCAWLTAGVTIQRRHPHPYRASVRMNGMAELINENGAVDVVGNDTVAPDNDNLHIKAATSDPRMFTLPWGTPLAQWPQDLIVDLPRGISRHVVRFIRVGNKIDAMKEIPRGVAEHEYEVLRQMQKLGIPCVEPEAVVTGRHNDSQGGPLESVLVTAHLKYSLPYRALFSRNIQLGTAEKLVDALAALMVHLHLMGFYWGDVSLSNVLFLRDAEEFAAFLVDAETAHYYEHLSDGQRAYDLDLARTNIIGELMDLSGGNLLPPCVDEVEVGNRLVDRYNSLWSALTETDVFHPDEMWRVEQRVDHLNDLGFYVDELDMQSASDGSRVAVRPIVVDAGYASRKLMRLTGLDVKENQARRLLNDLDRYRAQHNRQNEDREVVATDWMREVYEPTVAMIPQEYRSRIEPAQFFHDVLTHRWYMAQNAGHDIGTAEAAANYVAEILPGKMEDSAETRAINADADAGLIDDESVQEGL